MKFTDVILDFDGTCTQIPLAFAQFLKDYLVGLNLALPADKQISDKLWKLGQQEVKKNSPEAGWTLGTTPAAPAAADPYILSFETTRILLKYHLKISASIPPSVFANAYAANPAPWRVETLEVIKSLLQKNVSVHFVSNSDPQMIKHRLQDLWGGSQLPKTIFFHGNASKYNISEVDAEDKAGWTKQLKQIYDQVPAVQPSVSIGRPLYLRRGSFFSIIATIFNNDLSKLSSSIFCGDVWELDLALPATLGANIHLIERAAPFNTYAYERKLSLIKKGQGKISADLSGLLEWFS